MVITWLLAGKIIMFIKIIFNADFMSKDMIKLI